MKTLPDLLRHAVERHGERPAVLLKEGHDLSPVSYTELAHQVQQAACGLLTLATAPGECVVLLSENRPEWAVADLAILHCGAVNVPIFPTLPAEQVAPLIQRVGARLAIVEDAGQLAKLEAKRDELPRLEQILVFDMKKVPDDHPLAVSWESVVAAGAERSAELAPRVAERSAAVTEEDLATIIFTSGTTGVPKGVMLTHRNFVTNVVSTDEKLHIVPDDTLLSFLPLSHSFQRVVGYLGLYVGASTLYNESLRMLMPNLKLLQPTVLIAVPRMLAMMRERVKDGIAEKPGLAGLIARWALKVADRYSAEYVAGRDPSGLLKWQHQFCDRKVFAPLREMLGLSRCRFGVSGGAALPPELGRWLLGIGIKIAQGYGLTETSPVVSLIEPDRRLRFDSIGLPIPGVEWKVADDGELLVRGPNVMRGYYEMPEDTAAVIDAEGWFHTGDLAEELGDNFMRITGRKKDIMVLANGKNVAPLPIETALCESPLIDRVMLVGDDADVVGALIVPAYEALAKKLQAAGVTIADVNDRSWLEQREAERAIRAEIDRLTPHLASFEKVRRFKLLREEFSPERGELSLKMDLRRKQILANYAELVAELAE